MKYRHEWKFEVNAADVLILRQRLRAIIKPDSHTTDGRYAIRSLYFDDWYDSALRQKIDGVNQREKFRIRYYNGDTSFIKLEKKSKLGGLCNKQSVTVTAEEAERIVNGDIGFMASRGGLLTELYSKITLQGLRPKTIVDYKREAYVYPPGNVRVTIDYDIRTGLRQTEFLDPDTVTVPIPSDTVILEVKWDEYLPDIIKDAVGLGGRRTGAFSKYAAARIYE